MSQGEIVRLADLGLDAGCSTPARCCRNCWSRMAIRRSPARLAELIADGDFGDAALDDESLTIVRDQFHAFAADHVEAAHQWHLKDELIPLEVIGQLAEMGVFGLTVPEEFGGSGMGKLAMCVVTEELSRGYIGLGSLGTRSEIAAELIRLGGTDAAEAALAAEDRQRRDPADRRLHRTQYRLRSRFLRTRAVKRRRGLPRHRQQDLDHPCGPHRRDDPAGAHRCRTRPTIAASRCSSPKSRAGTQPIPSPPRA